MEVGRTLTLNWVATSGPPSGTSPGANRRASTATSPGEMAVTSVRTELRELARRLIGSGCFSMRSR